MLSRAQTPPSSREEKGSGVTSPNPWASSRSLERPIKSQNSVYVEARTLNNYKASRLLQAQGFRLVTPDPFLVRGLGLGTRQVLVARYLGVVGRRAHDANSKCRILRYLESGKLASHVVSCPARVRLPARNGLVNEVEFLGLITQNG